MKITFYLVGLGVALWLLLAAPTFLANTLWSDSNAPWEQVDAFYYPNANDLTVWKTQNNVGSIEACRLWVRDIATQVGDPDLLKGDYECGVGCERSSGLSICRLTVE